MKKKIRLDRLEQIQVINEIRCQSEFRILYSHRGGRAYHPGKNVGNAGT